MRTAIKKVLSSLEAGSGAAEALREAQRTLDIAAVRGVVHRNTASRRAGRLARRIHRAASSPGK